jgi:hypothetical protein
MLIVSIPKRASEQLSLADIRDWITRPPWFQSLKLDVQVFRQSLYERAQEWILGDLGFYHSYVYQRASK